MDYLLLQQIDPVKKADFFGVLFDEMPSYADLLSGTKEKGLVKGLNPLFFLAKSEDDLLVRSLDTVWNQFEASMFRMYEKLARLDFVVIAGEVTYIPREEVRNVWL
jgi:hypothetical protein